MQCNKPWPHIEYTLPFYCDTKTSMQRWCQRNIEKKEIQSIEKILLDCQHNALTGEDKRERDTERVYIPTNVTPEIPSRFWDFINICNGLQNNFIGKSAFGNPKRTHSVSPSTVLCLLKGSRLKQQIFSVHFHQYYVQKNINCFINNSKMTDKGRERAIYKDKDTRGKTAVIGLLSVPYSDTWCNQQAARAKFDNDDIAIDLPE